MENCNTGYYLLIFFLVSISFAVTCRCTHQKDDVVYEDVRIGLVVDMASMEGKFVRSSISMALSDFYHVNNGYRTRVSVLSRDSHGDPLQALAAAMDLLQTEQVEALVGGQSFLEATILAELGEKTKVPVISPFQVPSSSTLNKYNYFIQATHDASSEAKGITALFRNFDWRTVVLIYEDDDDWRESIQPLIGNFQQNAIRIEHKAEFSVSSNEEYILKHLRKFKASGIRIFVAHISECTANRLFPCARRLGMMEEGHAWILTARSMNNFQDTNYLAKEAMEGVIGFKSYIPLTEELQNFTLRWKRSLLLEEVTRMSICSIWAHDIAWSFALAAEVAKVPGLPVNDLLETMKENAKHKGLSGDFKFIDKKFVADKFEIVNMIGRGERSVALWNSGSFISNRRRHLFSTNAIETIIWPGGSTRIPKVCSLKEKRHGKKKKLRVLVPVGNINPQLLEVKTDFKTGVTAATGYCIEVFETSIRPFNYEVEYIPWPGAINYKNYNDLVYTLYSHKDKYDAAVGDITITDNRSSYVDFTLPFTDMGLAVVTAKDKSMWIIFKPLTVSLWLTIATFFILTGAIVWLIERHDNADFQGSCFQQIGTLLCFGFSTLVFAHRERLQHNMSKFVVIVWIFAVLILTSNYTATLTSVMTVQQIRELKSKENIGFFSDSIAANVVKDNPAFQGPRYKGLKRADDYRNALKNGSILFIVEEVPYIKLFVAKYPSEFDIVKTESVTNGFGFAFQKGSPLVQKVSREIAKLRRTEKLKAIENWWFQRQTTSATSGDTFDPLTVYMFRGLFMITGVSFAFALTVYLIPWNRDQRQVVLKHFHRYVSHQFARAICPSPTIPNSQNENAAI